MSAALYETSSSVSHERKIKRAHSECYPAAMFSLTMVSLSFGLSSLGWSLTVSSSFLCPLQFGLLFLQICPQSPVLYLTCPPPHVLLGFYVSQSVMWVMFVGLEFSSWDVFFFLTDFWPSKKESDFFKRPRLLQQLWTVNKVFLRNIKPIPEQWFAQCWPSEEQWNTEPTESRRGRGGPMNDSPSFSQPGSQLQPNPEVKEVQSR